MTAASGVNIIIRDIDGAAEIRAVEGLQKEVWGIPDLDVVPLTQLIAAKAAGGVLVGAFDGKTLVGFVYGFPGYEHGQRAHHSHMLAVRPEYRNFDLGKRLKMAQREEVLAQGVTRMTWTFDPLQSLNAHFNFNKLGVIADRYLINFYGEDAASFLHRTGTDRLWVTWLLSSERVQQRLNRSRLPAKPPAVTPLVQLTPDDLPQLNKLKEAFARDEILIQIPNDITGLERRSKDKAGAWREATRWAFNEALNEGYIVTDFDRDKTLGTYSLSRENPVT